MDCLGVVTRGKMLAGIGVSGAGALGAPKNVVALLVLGFGVMEDGEDGLDFGRNGSETLRIFGGKTATGGGGLDCGCDWEL